VSRCSLSAWIARIPRLAVEGTKDALLSWRGNQPAAVLSGKALRTSNLISFVLGAAACFVLAGLDALRYGQPLSIRGDHLNLLAQVKGFIEDGGLRYVQALGFPGVRDNLFFPLFDAGYLGTLWSLSWITRNPFRVISLFYLVGVLLMFAFSYLALRRLAVRSWVASAIAIAYVISPYFLARAGGHDFLALYYGVPLGAALPLLMTACQTVHDFRRLFFGCFGVLAIMVSAISGLYYAFFTAMLIGVTGLALTIGRRNATPLLAAAAVSVVIFVVVVLGGYGTGVLEVVRGSIPQTDRHALHQLFFSLLISDALHVYRDIGLGPGLFAAYEGYNFGTYADGGRRQWPGVVFTTVILAAPVLAVARAVVPTGATSERGSASSERGTMAWLALALITLLLVFSMRGGLGYIFNHVVGPWIRGQVRILPFLSFYAAVLVCFAVEALWSRGRAWHRLAALIVAVGTVASILPYTRPLVRKQQTFLESAERQADVASVRAVLAAKDGAGLKAVLQLPYMHWPETPPQRDFAGYVHQLLFIYDRHQSQTRWSYGMAAKQPDFSRVRAALTPGQPAGLVDRARALKYDGILIERRAYTAEEMKAITDTLTEQVGTACLVHDDALRVLFALERGRGGEACHGGRE
jgi:hypothetical protein